LYTFGLGTAWFAADRHHLAPIPPYLIAWQWSAGCWCRTDGAAVEIGYLRAGFTLRRPWVRILTIAGLLLGLVLLYYGYTLV